MSSDSYVKISLGVVAKEANSIEGIFRDAIMLVDKVSPGSRIDFFPESPLMTTPIRFHRGVFLYALIRNDQNCGRS